jgi:hypothetical protein
VYKATRHYSKSETEEADEGGKKPSEAHEDDFSPLLLEFLAASRSSHYTACKKRKVDAEETSLRRIIILRDEKEGSKYKKTAPVMV